MQIKKIISFNFFLMANRIAVLWRFIKVYVHTVIMVVVALFLRYVL